MKIKNKLTALTRVAAVIAFLVPVGAMAAPTTDSAAISKLLGEVKIHAAHADEDANTLDSFTKSKLSWKSHASQISQIKEHVNDLIRDSNQLSSLRSEGSPWQQQAIDHIHELLPQMASHLSAMIKHMSENQNRLNMPPFQDFIHANYVLISNAHGLINDYVDYDEAKSKAEALEKELQLTTPSNSGE